VSDVKITINENGPLKVEGDVPLFDHEDNRIEPPRTDRYFLCRCGGSTNKPFCDGTHSKIGFIGAEAAVEAADDEATAGATGVTGTDEAATAVVATDAGAGSGGSPDGASERRRDAYVERLKETLDEWNAQIDRVEARVADAQADAKVRYREILDELESRRAEADARLREIQGASGSAWEELKDGAETAWESLREAVRKARQEFDRQG